MLRKLLAATLGLSLLTCSSLPEALTAIDVIGRSTAKVLGWCETNAAGDSRLAQARDAYEKKDFLAAAVILQQVVADVRALGKEPSDDIKQSERLLGALAAEGIQDGMRAVSLQPRK
jgi:hypothetical protein